MGFAREGAAFPDDGVQQYDPGRRAVYSCWPVPDDALEIGVFGPLPFPRAFFGATLAAGKTRGFSHGPASRSVLSGMLLDFDGTALRGWGDESSLDCRDNGVCVCGKSPAGSFICLPMGLDFRRRIDLKRDVGLGSLIEAGSLGKKGEFFL